MNANVDYPTSQTSYTETKAGGQDSYPEELTYYYLDLQFMGTDILTWYEDGYFGLAPDDAPFHPLSSLIPYLGHELNLHHQYHAMVEVLNLRILYTTILKMHILLLVLLGEVFRHLGWTLEIMQPILKEVTKKHRYSHVPVAQLK